MGQIDQALRTLRGLFGTILSTLVSQFGTVERILRELLLQLGASERVQGPIIVIAAVMFILLVLRLFGGILRILLIVFLILLILRILAPVLEI